nr:hypothetical protein HmN_000293400 [Hymenolepis microstoma]
MELELDVKFDAVEKMVVVELLVVSMVLTAPSASASVQEWGNGSGGGGVGGCGGEDGGGDGMKYEDLES